jgi:hypothetical protein
MMLDTTENMAARLVSKIGHPLNLCTPGIFQDVVVLGAINIDL